MNSHVDGKVKKGKRAIIVFYKMGTRKEKNVPVSRAFIIADEYRRTTGSPVVIRLS